MKLHKNEKPPVNNLRYINYAMIVCTSLLNLTIVCLLNRI